MADHYQAKDRPFLGVVCVSEHDASMLSYAFPGARVDRVRISVDANLFHPVTDDVTRARPRTISYMPRRGSDDIRAVIGMLQGRRAMKGWEFAAVNGLPEHLVGDALRKSSIYLAVTAHEGFGLPAAEAMACGNYVIGNHGHGGREFFDPSFSKAVATGDLLDFAKQVELAVLEEESQPGWLAERGRMSSDAILTRYTREREALDVEAIYRDLLPGLPPR